MKSIGDRMKQNYENRYRHYLTRRTPVIMRLDGKAFHTLTRHCEKPFDDTFTTAMNLTAEALVTSIQGAKLAYVQSDEISILLTDFDKLDTEAWFDYNIQKMTSVSAATASTIFMQTKMSKIGIGIFDSRVFNIPKEDMVNYFVWRQQDWVRNSVQMLAQSHFSHKKLHGKNQADMHEMLYTKDVNWANLEPRYKNGGCYMKFNDVGWVYYSNMIFQKERNVIENLLKPTEE